MYEYMLYCKIFSEMMNIIMYIACNVIIILLVEITFCMYKIPIQWVIFIQVM